MEAKVAAANAMVDKWPIETTDAITRLYSSICVLYHKRKYAINGDNHERMTRTRRLAKCILREYASPPKTWSYLTLYHYDLHLQVLPGFLAPKVPTAGYSQLDYSQPQGVYLTWCPWTVWQEAVDVCRTKESCFAGDSELWLCPLRRPLLLCDCVLHFRDRHGQTWLGWHDRWGENQHDDLDLRPWQGPVKPDRKPYRHHGADISTSESLFYSDHRP